MGTVNIFYMKWQNFYMNVKICQEGTLYERDINEHFCRNTVKHLFRDRIPWSVTCPYEIEISSVSICLPVFSLLLADCLFWTMAHHSAHTGVQPDCLPGVSS